MKTIVVNNLKGGVAKTTTVVNVAYSLAGLGKNVLVIDADPQANTTSFFAKVNQHTKTLKDVLANPNKCKSSIYRTKYENIDIIKGDTTLAETDAWSKSWLKEVKRNVDDKYDYCLVDTRPSFSNLTVSSMYGADIILTPACMDSYCRNNLSLVEDAIDTIKEEEDVEWKVFATKIDVRRKAQRETYLDLSKHHNYPFLNTCVSASADVDNAAVLFKPIGKHRSKSPVALDYMCLAIELIEECEV